MSGTELVGWIVAAYFAGLSATLVWGGERPRGLLEWAAVLVWPVSVPLALVTLPIVERRRRRMGKSFPSPKKTGRPAVSVEGPDAGDV